MLDKSENRFITPELAFPLGAADATMHWRPIHYLGSKLRLVAAIRAKLAQLDPTGGPLCDLFAGSGTVAMALCGERDVVAADIQEYSRVLCSALLKTATVEDSIVSELAKVTIRNQARFEKYLEPLLDYEERALACAATNPSPLCDLAEYGSLESVQDCRGELELVLRETKRRIAHEADALAATRYYGGSYFSYRQTLFMDAVLSGIDQMPMLQRDTLVAAVLSTASALVNSIGKQFAQPMRPRRKDGTIKKHLIAQMSRDRHQDACAIFTDWLSKYRLLPKRLAGHRVIRGDFRDVLTNLGDISVIYADPPYTRDHYSRFYHVLETLSLRDSPSISTTSLTGQGRASRGAYRTDRHQSPFCIKSQASGAFSELFAGAKRIGVPLLLSYSPFIKQGHPRLMTIESVAKLAAQHYSYVEITPAGSVTHSKLNRTGLHLEASLNAEVFITCR